MEQKQYLYLFLLLFSSEFIFCMMTRRVTLSPLGSPLGGTMVVHTSQQPSGTGNQAQSSPGSAKSSSSATSIVSHQTYKPPVSLSQAQAYQAATAQTKGQMTGGQLAIYNIKRQDAPLNSYVTSLQTKYTHVPESILLADVIGGTEDVSNISTRGFLGTYKTDMLRPNNFDSALQQSTQREDDSGRTELKSDLTAAQQLHLSMSAINKAYQAPAVSTSPQTQALVKDLITKYDKLIDPILLEKYVNIVLTQHPNGKPSWGGWGSPTPWTIDNILDANLTGGFEGLGKGIIALNQVYKSSALQPYVQHESISLQTPAAAESKSSHDSMSLAFGTKPGTLARPRIIPPLSEVKSDAVVEFKTGDETIVQPAPAQAKKDKNAAPMPKPPLKKESKLETIAEESVLFSDKSPEDHDLDFDTKQPAPQSSWLRNKLEEYKNISDLRQTAEEAVKELKEELKKPNNASPEEQTALRKQIKDKQKEVKDLKMKEKILNTLKGLAVAGALSGLGTLSKELDEQEKKKKSKKKSSDDDEDFNEDLFTEDDDFADTPQKPQQKKDKKESETKTPAPKEDVQKESEIEQFFKSIEPLSAQGHTVTAKITSKSTLNDFIKDITADIFMLLQIPELLPERLLMSIETDSNFIELQQNAFTNASQEWLPPRFNDSKFANWLSQFQAAIIDYIINFIENQPSNNY